MRRKIVTVSVLGASLLLPTAPGVVHASLDAMPSIAASHVQTAGNTRYYKSSWYPGYVAVRFSGGKSKVRAVFQGDGPVWCFVGRRVSPGVYRGTNHTFGGGSQRQMYNRSELVGRRVSPPAWFRKSSAKAFRVTQCR